MKVKVLLFVGICITNIVTAQTKVEVQVLNGFSDLAIKARLDSAIKLIEMVVNSRSFAEKVEGTNYLRNQGKTGKELLNLLKQGKEEGTQPDSIINLKVDVYEDTKHEIGNTDNNNITHTNKDYILSNGAACYAAHLIHEYCHILGFSHAGMPLPFRSKTVPYKIGNLAAEILDAECP